jgi:hypothetical protein
MRLSAAARILMTRNIPIIHVGVHRMFLRSLLLIVFGFASSTAMAIGTAFSYQGTLEDSGQPANGSYDLQFRVTSASAVQIGPVLVNENVAVTGGVFTVQLDFGDNVFSGNDRLLEIGVRPGTSAGTFTILTPSTPLHPAPYAQMASNAELADLALDVTDNAIDEIDIGTGAVSTRNIATGAVAAAELATGAVGTAELANDAVTGDKVASNTLSMAHMVGVSGNGTISATIAANDCADFDVTFGGDVQQGDFPLIAVQAGFQLPDSMSLTALRVVSDNVIELRVCNELGAQQSFSGLGIKLITLR